MLPVEAARSSPTTPGRTASMYLDYFSLKRHPFRITPDPSLFFHGGAHGRGVVLDALVYGISSGEGILKVVGEVGSGKTMLCRMLEERLPATVEIVYLANPNLTARDIVYAIAFELKLPVDASTDRLVVMHKLQDYLLSRHAAGASVVVFIEEAQSMPLETLEEVRLLSNLETHRHKLMQIMLFGQPELDRKLENKSIRQLRERITHSFELQPLNEQEVREYLHFRLQAAGCPYPQLFSTNAEQLLARASAGLSRRINILADKALLAAYADPSVRPEMRNSAGEILPMVLPKHVRIAIKDSGYLIDNPGLRQAVLYGSSLAAVLLLGIGVGWWFTRQSQPALPVQVVASTPAPATPQSEVLQPVVSPVPAALAEVATESPAMPDTAATVAAAVAAGAAPVTVPATVAVTVTDTVPAASGLASTDVAAQSVLNSAQSSAPPQTAAVTADSYKSTTLVGDTVAPGAASTTASTEPVPVATSEPVLAAAPVVIPAGLSGLVAVRAQASVPWLAALPGRDGYSVQMYAVGVDQLSLLQEYFEFLELSGMFEHVYMCRISASGGLKAQWLLLHELFAGYSEAELFIRQLPPYLAQHKPYVRNVKGIACTN